MIRYLALFLACFASVAVASAYERPTQLQWGYGEEVCAGTWNYKRFSECEHSSHGSYQINNYTTEYYTENVHDRWELKECLAGHNDWMRWIPGAQGNTGGITRYYTPSDPGSSQQRAAAEVCQQSGCNCPRDKSNAIEFSKLGFEWSPKIEPANPAGRGWGWRQDQVHWCNFGYDWAKVSFYVEVRRDITRSRQVNRPITKYNRKRSEACKVEESQYTIEDRQKFNPLDGYVANSRSCSTCDDLPVIDEKSAQRKAECLLSAVLSKVNEAIEAKKAISGYMSLLLRDHDRDLTSDQIEKLTDHILNIGTEAQQ